MRGALLLSAILVIFGSRAFAEDVEFQLDSNTPLRLHSAHSLVVIHKITKSISIGAGTTALDPLRTIECRSTAGCVVTANVTIGYNVNYCPSVSAYVDGVAMTPSFATCDDVLTLQQSKKIATGTHTIQTEITEQSGGDGTVLSLEAEYTLYGR